MLRRISFALVADPRASFTHFIDSSAQCVAVDKLDELEEAHVGIFTDLGPMPTEAQLSSILLLAEMATVMNPKAEIVFGPGSSPFAWRWWSGSSNCCRPNVRHQAGNRARPPFLLRGRLFIMRTAARIRGMFSCNVYRKGKSKTLSDSDWRRLRDIVAEHLRKNPGSQWGMVKKGEETLIRRVRHTMHSYPLEEPWMSLKYSQCSAGWLQPGCVLCA